MTDTAIELDALRRAPAGPLGETAGETAAESVRNTIVERWLLPPEGVENNRESTTHYKKQLILQLEDDPVVAKAAAMLAGKHPESSILVKLDNEGNFRVLERAITPDGQVHWSGLSAADSAKRLQEAFSTLKGSVRWQLVGHGRTANREIDGRNNTTLAGLEPEALANNLKTLATATRCTPDYISLVGCALTGAADMENSFAGRLTVSLYKKSMAVTVAARAELL